jgi:hypothetical protein
MQEVEDAFVTAIERCKKAGCKFIFSYVYLCLINFTAQSISLKYMQRTDT